MGVLKMRLLFNLLNRIQEGITPNSKYYKMDSNEYNNFLKLLVKQGFIQSSKEIRLGYIVEYKITAKGIEFLEENKHFKFEMPKDELEIPHWVRFEGKEYKPRVKEVISTSNSNNFYGNIDYSHWTESMEIAIDASIQRNGSGNVQIAGKSTEEEVSKIEEELGITIPDSFKRVLLSYSKRVYFFWYVPESNAYLLNYESCMLNNEEYYATSELESELKIQGGGFLDDGLWDLDKLVDYNSMREDLDYLDDEYKQQWAYSLVFARDGMGSYYAIDLKYNVGEVIFLSNEGQYHGWRLGKDFESFFANWIKIGCAGSYVKDLIAFSTLESPYVSIDSASSKTLKIWMSTKS
ncbi:hypothetical protein B1748_25820 [Paenibacillus sp. MY03]|nr:hypothetical protein B1748_25820 [Paenibacillus sp. MY03]